MPGKDYPGRRTADWRRFFGCLRADWHWRRFPATFWPTSELRWSTGHRADRQPIERRWKRPIFRYHTPTAYKTGKDAAVVFQGQLQAALAERVQAITRQREYEEAAGRVRLRAQANTGQI
jgi:hypothetical protein